MWGNIGRTKKKETIVETKSKNEYKAAIKEIEDIFASRKLDDYTHFEMTSSYLQLLYAMFDSGTEDEKKEACRMCITNMIARIEKQIELCSVEYMPKYMDLYEQAYCLAGRRSLEHFVDYMELDNDNRVLEKRRGILKPFLFYLNKIAFDPNMKYVIASYPPSAGKSFCLNYFSAWIFGLSIDNSILRLSYSEDLVTGFSRSIKAIIVSPRFSNVFPQYKPYNGKPFEKQAEDDWKIKNAKTISSHMAKSRDGQITGKRANKAIIFDDMTKRSNGSNELHFAPKFVHTMENRVVQP